MNNVSMEAIERDLAAVIQRLSWPRLSLVATGMPGPLAMKYAAERPDSVASLLLRGDVRTDRGDGRRAGRLRFAEGSGAYPG